MRPTKNDVRYEYVPRKNVSFCFISIFWVHFSHKTKKFQFWKSLKYFNILWPKKIIMASDLTMSYGKMSDFVLFPWFMLISVVKLSKFHFTTLREKCPYSELFWSTFFRIRTKYGEILLTFPYSVQMRENAYQNNSVYGLFFT